LLNTILQPTFGFGLQVMIFQLIQTTKFRRPSSVMLMGYGAENVWLRGMPGAALLREDQYR
jgi:hypothetical protein